MGKRLIYIEWGIAAKAVDYFFALPALTAFATDEDFGIGFFSS